MADPQETLKTVLTANWVAANADSITPKFYVQKEFSEELYDLDNDMDIVIIRQLTGSQEPNSLGRANKMEEETCEVSYTTAKSRAHFDLAVTEMTRALDVSNSHPDASYDEWEIVRKQDVSSTFKKVWRFAFDVTLKRWNVIR